MNKTIFLDRDGTINVDYGYVYDINKLEFVNGVISSLKRLCEMGYQLIVITNQSGIGRGYFGLDDYYKFEKNMLDRLKIEGVNIKQVYVCPHSPEEECNCRKPKTALFEQAAIDWDVDWSLSFAIGDRIRDLCICNYKPVKGILLGKEETLINTCFDFKICSTWSEIEEYIYKTEKWI